MSLLPFHRRLNIQVTLPITVIAFLIVGLLGYIVERGQNQIALYNAQLELRSMLVVAQGSLNRIFGFGRYDSVGEALSEFQVHPRVTKTAILSPTGELASYYSANAISPHLRTFVQHLGRQQIAEVARSGVTIMQYHPEHNHFIAMVPVVSGKVVGNQQLHNVFIVEYEHARNWYTFANVIFNELVLFLTVLLLVGIILWVILQRKIVRPVRRLMVGVDKLARRESLQDFDIHSDNELGLLGDSLRDAALQREQHEKQLLRFSSAVEQSHDSIVITNLAGEIEYVNKAFTDITGYSLADVQGRNPKILSSGETPRSSYDAMWTALVAGRSWQGELYNLKKNGEPYREWVTIAPLRSPSGDITHYIATKQNITERRAAEAQVQYLAYYDVLTGLPNRTQCQEILQQFLDERDYSTRGAVALLDLDGLQRINDVRGFEFGDLILLAVTERIGHVMKAEPEARVGCLGGDLFAVLFPTRSAGREATVNRVEFMVKDLLAELAEPMLIEGERISITASAGIVVYPEYGDNPEAILRHAETAVHNAKDAGGNQIAVYNPAYSYALEQRFEVERELREAIANNQLELYLQSQQLSNGEVVGVEVLVRWNHPTKGIVSPGVFIPIAEMSDLIVDLGRWILRAALHVLKHLPGQQTLAINISPRQFRKYDFVYQIEREVVKSGVDASRLILEVTENLLVDDVDDVVAKMKALQKSGVQFSIDDFGTGYSSLSYLSQLPLHELKIDQSFVQGIGEEEKEQLVETVIAMGNNLNLRVVAEGVETKQQVEFLSACSAQVVCQGYYFAKPIPASEYLANQSQQ
ncbi:EAL domain-containing protein [Pseudidiomarina sp. WS423]|uniref:EAL domain-containing protein n=1 Tax=Pseudidiomarina sp. WS423 TaxID=3425124 RepID=UPI003D70204A